MNEQVFIAFVVACLAWLRCWSLQRRLQRLEGASAAVGSEDAGSVRGLDRRISVRGQQVDELLARVAALEAKR